MEKRYIWVPVSKSKENDYNAILSDTSIDRDKEIISKDLIKKWSEKSILPSLVNHENKMEKWVGGWTDLKVIEKGNHSALLAKPFFFSKEANPLAYRVQKQVEEAIEKGLHPGISISAIPSSSSDIEKDGETYKQWDEAELLEATWVPIQSNRNATFGHLAKRFDIKQSIDTETGGTTEEQGLMSKPKKVDECVKSLMADPDFKPQKGRTKEESAWAVCTAKFKEYTLKTKQTEENKMKVKKDAVAEPETQSEAPVEDQVEETAEEKALKENEQLKKEIKDLKKANEDLETQKDDRKLILDKMPTIESSEKVEVEAKHPTTIQMIKEYYGGNTK